MEFLVVMSWGTWKTVYTTMIATTITVLSHYLWYGLLTTDAIGGAGRSAKDVVLLLYERDDVGRDKMRVEWDDFRWLNLQWAIFFYEGCMVEMQIKLELKYFLGI